MTTEHAVTPPPWSLMVGASSTPGHVVSRAESRVPGAPGPAEDGGGQDFSAYMSNIAAEHDRFAVAQPLNPTGGFGEDGFGLDDFVDIINPLQHLPIVSTAYRALTGDEMSAGSRVAGGALFGGPVGLANALLNGAVEAETGRDVGGTMMAALFGDDVAPDTPDTGSALAFAAAESGDDAALDAAAQAFNATAPAAGAPATPQTQADVAATSPLFAASQGPLIQAQNTGPLIGGRAATPFAALPPNGPPNINDVIQASTASTEPQRPLQAAAQGVPTLSPDAATALMRMAQNTAPAQVTAAAMTPPPAPTQAAQRIAAPQVAAAPEPAFTPPPAEAASPKPSAPVEVAPTARPALTASESAGSSAADTGRIGFVEPVASADLPSAMMEALSKYEAMKQGG